MFTRARSMLAALLVALTALLPAVPVSAATIAQATAIVTRTNDTNAYGALDVVGAATGATAAVSFTLAPGEAVVRIVTTTLEIDASAIIMSETSYALYLYRETPPSALGDNVAWDLPSGDRAAFIGSLALGTPADVGASLFIQVDNIMKDIYLPTGVLYAYLVTAAAHTPTASRVYRVRILGEIVGGQGSPGN